MTKGVGVLPLVLGSLGSYIRLLISKTYMRILAAVDFVAVAFALLNPTLQLPQFVAWVMAIVTLLLGGYDIYRDQQQQLAQYRPSPEAVPKISIAVVEGNAYSYSLVEPKFYMIWDDRATHHRQQMDAAREAGDLDEQQKHEQELKKAESQRDEFQDKHITPSAHLILHLRIFNIGVIAVELLTIRAVYDDPSPLYYLNPTITNISGQPLTFPLSLEPGETLLCNAHSSVGPESTFNNAQVAARFGETPSSPPVHSSVTLSVEAIGANNKRFITTSKFPIAVKPLIDLYIERWQQLGAQDLVRLARAGR